MVEAVAATVMPHTVHWKVRALIEISHKLS
jgi:hypothetical protein